MRGRRSWRHTTAYHAIGPSANEGLVTYTIWMRGRRIGETRFELSEPFQRRVGAFLPTAHGLTVLPGITTMFPALLEFAEMCHRHGLDVNDDWSRAVTDTARAFSETPEG